MINKLILCRHAETDTNTRGILHKTHDPIGLSGTGIEQARSLGEVLRREKAGIIVCSSEARALQTAEIANGGSGIEIIQTTDLHERDWGEWAGKPWSEIQAILDPMSLDERYTFVPPEGESWQDFETRLTGALKEIEALPYSTVAAITHGGTLRALMPIIKNEPNETSFKYDFHNASITIFEKKIGKYVKVTEDDISHLSL